MATPKHDHWSHVSLYHPPVVLEVSTRVLLRLPDLILLPDDNSFVHVDVNEVRAGASVGLPVGFGVLVSQFVRSMVIG